VGSCGLAGTGGDLWSVRGGNASVARKLIEHSNAYVLP